MWYKQGVEKSENKTLEQLRVGDSITAMVLLGWRPVAIVPQEVAETWVFTSTPMAVIKERGWRADDSPIKNWQKGIGIIVGVITAFPGYERLNLLHRNNRGEYVLYLSEGDEGIREVVELSHE